MSEINEPAKDLTEETSNTTVEQTDEQIKAVRIGEPPLLAGPVQIVDYDPTWPQLFEREAARIRAALGNRILLLFRNWLRSNVSDRQLYERTKRELAGKNWKYMQNYADAKTLVVEEILARAQAETRDEMRKEN